MKPTFNLSEFKISVFSSFTRASRIEALVTLRSASSIRYLNASTCFMSNLYSFILLPLAPCSLSILLNTASSFSALGRHPTTLFFPHRSLGTTKDSDIPVRPARAVRPTLCVYDREEVGKSKFRTHATSTKSTPRVTPYSLALLLSFRSRFLGLLDGGEGSRFRLFDPVLEELGSGDVSSTGSR